MFGWDCKYLLAQDVVELASCHKLQYQVRVELVVEGAVPAEEASNLARKSNVCGRVQSREPVAVHRGENVSLCNQMLDLLLDLLQ